MPRGRKSAAPQPEPEAEKNLLVEKNSEPGSLCAICYHVDRVNIEHGALMVSNAEELAELLLQYGGAFTAEDLLRHMAYHTPFGGRMKYRLVQEAEDNTLNTGFTINPEALKKSLSAKLELTEADLLLSAAMEYNATMAMIGQRIRSCLIPEEEVELPAAVSGVYFPNSESDTYPSVKQLSPNRNSNSLVLERLRSAPQIEGILTKPMVELYLGCGAKIGEAIQRIAELDAQINGAKDQGASQLELLGAVIGQSIAANAGQNA